MADRKNLDVRWTCNALGKHTGQEESLPAKQARILEARGVLEVVKAKPDTSSSQ